MKKKRETRAKTQRRKEEKNFFTRAEEKEALTYRTVAIGARAEGGPESLDEKTRSIEVVGATENPVEVWDWNRFEIVREVCLMSGCVLPANRQTVLLDTHQRYGTGCVVGSYRDMHIEKNQMVGRAYFTSLPEGDAPYIKVKEGHVTDFSVGYRVMESEWVKAGETSVIQGRKFEGPLRVTTKWVPREMSVCPLGADEMAKVREDKSKISDLRFQKENKFLQQAKEEQKMKKRMREILIKRGMNADATDDEAWVFLEKQLEIERIAAEAVATVEAAQTKVPDAQMISRESVRIERERVVEIEVMCRRFDVPDEERAKMVGAGVEVDAARKTVMDLVEKRQKENPQRLPTYPMIEGVADEGDKFRAAASDSLILRAGNSQMPVDRVAPGAQELRGYSLREMARLCLQRSGERVPFNVMEMIGRAMVTGDFPLILANVANKELFAGYESAPETWPIWCATGSVSDFKTHSAVRPSEFSDLDEVPEHGEYKFGKMTEGREQYYVTPKGKLFALTRQTIINDDLNALSDTPRFFGEAAARKVGDAVYAILTANGNMGDGHALFSSTYHSNVGTAGAINEVTMAEMVLLFGVQKNLQGLQNLNIPLNYIIGPKAIEAKAEVFFGSAHFATTNEAATRSNPYAGTKFMRVYEPRLDAASATCWYGAGPKGKTVKVFFLNGVQVPYLESRNGFTVDGVEFKVRIDAGAKAMDWKALASNDGA